MSVAADTFADFVDGLAEALDDHDRSGDDWAARHHFSRFHFDRMIKAVGGEPPQTLRRRILLERAAYRMIATKAPLIDIAVEAGYSSHEAFTRAFTKAYDVPPREWRKKPGHIQIGDPVAVHFVPPGSIRLPSRDTVKGADLVEKMVEHHVWLTGEMVRLAERLTPEQLDEPVLVEVDDDEQTLRSLLSRLVGQMGMWNAAMATRDYDWSVEDHESLGSMRRRLGIEGPRYLAHGREVCDQGRIDDTFVDALCEQAEVFTYGGMIAHVLTFAAYRRTLVVMALARHGHDELGWGDPMRWVAGRDGPATRHNGRVEIAFLLVALAVIVLAGTTLAERVGFPAPLALIVVGIAASYVRGVPTVHLSADVVILGLLPPLLYSAAIQTSLVDFNANRRSILLLSVGLVVFTTFGVGSLVHALLPGIDWWAALAIGAVVAPPDAVAATTIGRRIGLPRRIVTILEGESLFNDATALVALRTTIAAGAGSVALGRVGVDFLVASVGGALIGFVAFLVVAKVRKRVTDPVLDTAIARGVPFARLLASW